MQRLLYTFGFIMLLMAVFLGLWWQQSYRKDIATLRDQIEGEMNQLVSDEFVFPTLEAVMDQEQHQQLSEYWVEGHYGGHPRRIHVQRGIVGFDGRPKLDITIIGNGLPTLRSHFFYDKRRFALSELPAMVRDSMYRKFGVELTPIALSDQNMELTHRHGLRTNELSHPMSVAVKHVAQSGAPVSRTTFIVQNYVATVLIGMIPELIFGLILFMATGFAFLSAYRNISEQRQQLQAKDVLVANVAHELKTPIATVGVALEALNTFGADQDPTRRQEYLAIGQAELKRLDAMADRAIDSMHDGDLAAKLKLMNTDLTHSVQEAWRGLALRYRFPEDALTLSAYGDVVAPVDPHYWHHLVYNLLDNACKYGGRPLRLDVNIAGHAGETVLTVTDNGAGIPIAERRNIFERFYRIHRPDEGHAVKGHGLGLSFVRQIARAHGGNIEVDNAAGGGARFTVRLPG